MGTANAVARVENLEFLSDVVPRTMTMKQYKQKAGAESGLLLGKGQGTLGGHVGANGKAPAAPEREIAASDEEAEEDEEMQDS